VAHDLLEDVHHRRERHAGRDDLLARLDQCRARQLEPPAPERDHRPKVDRALERARVVLGGHAEARRELLEGGDLRLLGLPAGQRGALEAEHVLPFAAGAVDQPLDRREVEAVGLHLADQLEAVEVLLRVVAGPPAHLGRRQQPTRLVRADVPGGQAGALRQVVDGQELPVYLGQGADTKYQTVTPFRVT
jgi:hypothetical protein